MGGRRSKRDVRALPLDGLRAEAERLREVLAELARRRADPVEGLLSAMEGAVEDAKQAFGHEALDVLLARMEPEGRRPQECPKCGKSIRVRADARPRTVQTLSGAITFRRNYHYCDLCEYGFYPRDRELGLPEEGDVSREVEKRILDFGVNAPFAEAAERWNVHYEWPVSSHLVRNVVGRCGARLEATHDAALDQTTMARPSKAPDVLFAANDGAHIATRDEDWRESKLAVLVRGDQYLSHREGNRGVIGAARYAGVLGDQKEFRHRLDMALRMERAGSAKTLVWLGDGAPGNWRLAADLAPGCVEILDWYHAVEQAMDCAKVVLGEQSSLLVDWRRTICQLLSTGAVEEILGQLALCAFAARGVEREALRNLQRYYQSNAKRMQYADYLRRGLPIGSGIVESAHRHVIQRRMKGAGKRWSLRGARRMVRLRCAYQTAGPQRFHLALLRAHHLTATDAIPRVGWRKQRASNR